MSANLGQLVALRRQEQKAAEKAAQGQIPAQARVRKSRRKVAQIRELETALRTDLVSILQEPEVLARLRQHLLSADDKTSLQAFDMAMKNLLTAKAPERQGGGKLALNFNFPRPGSDAVDVTP